MTGLCGAYDVLHLLSHSLCKSQTKTDLIALFDVDMLPSNTLYQELKMPDRLKWYGTTV